MNNKNVENILSFGDKFKKEEIYWKEVFSKKIESNRFPINNNSIDNKKYELGTYCYKFNKEIFEKILTISNKSDYGTFMILLTGVTYILHKYSNDESVMVGMPPFRNDNEKVNYNKIIPLISHINYNNTYKEFLLYTKKNVINANKYQNIPKWRIMDFINVHNNIEEKDLFKVVVMFNKIHDLDDTNQCEYDINFIFDSSNGYLRCNANYNTLIYSEDILQKMFDHLINFYWKVISYPEIKLSELSILSIEEKYKLLNEYNDTTKLWENKKTVIELFEDQTRNHPDSIAVKCGDKSLTYSQLNKRANSIAFILKNKGVASDCIVAIMVERSIEMLIGILGILKAGGAYLPIDPDYPLERICYLLKDSSTKILLTQNKLNYKIDFDGEIIDLTDKNIYSINRQNLNFKNKINDLAYIIYTSGSTGKPKGVMIENRSLINFLFTIIHEYENDFDVKDKCLCLTNVVFDVSVCEMFISLISGASLIINNKHTTFDKNEIAELIIEEGITFTYIPPSLLNEVCNALNASKKIIKLNKLLVGVESIQEYILENYLKLNSNMQIINGYGPTEATICATFYKFFGIKKNGNKNVPIGKPLKNSKIYILDRNKNLQPIGIPGEIFISGEGLARGYMNDSDLTNKKFIPNLFVNNERIYKTGDLGRWLNDGNIEFLGRIDNQVKIRGYRIELGEIETEFLRHNIIKEAKIICKKDKNNINELYAYLVTEKDITIEVIKNHILKELPNYMIPSNFVRVEKMPLTPNGKIDQKKLQEIGKVLDTGIIYEAPRNSIEEKLVNIWLEILNVNNIGINDNFFMISGHSLKAMILSSKIQKELNVEVPISVIFKLPTIKSLSEYIQNTEPNTYLPIDKIQNSEYYLASSAQKRIYALQQLNPQSISYNMPMIMEAEGKLDKRRLRSTIDSLIKRHETLRTSFDTKNGEIIQRVKDSLQIDIAYINIEDENESIEKVIKDFIKPFDLKIAPILRVGVIKLNKQKFIIMIDTHHIVFDGVSFGILRNEFTRIYRGESLNELKLQYKDYSAWQSKLLKSSSMTCQENFWLGIFKDPPPVLNMTYDYPRPAVQTFEGDDVGIIIENDITKELRVIAKETGSTMYMVLLSAITMLIAKYSNQEDIIIGSPIAGRRHSDFEGIIGMFVNTLAMRNKPEKEKTIIEFISEVKKNSLDVYENQDYPFDELIEKLNIKMDLSRNPLFDVMFAMQNMDISKIEIEDITFRTIQNEDKTSKFDLTFVAVENNDEIFLNISFSTGLFKISTIKKMAEHLKNILKIICRNKDYKIGDINIINDEERHQILYEFNDTDMEYDRNKVLHQLFEEQVIKTPYNIAIATENKKLTYDELNKSSNRLAWVLREKGVKSDDIVGVMIERSLETVISVLAVLKAGGGVLPIDSRYPEERIISTLNDSNLKILITKKNEIKEMQFCKLQGLNGSSTNQFFSEPRPQILEFNELPIPDRTLIDNAKYHKFIGLAAAKNSISIQATRGCPYNCSFCHKIWPKKHVVRSAENIFSEIQMYYDVGIRRFVFIDDIFNLDIQNGSSLFQLIIANKLNVQLYFPNGLRGDILTKEYIDLMVRAGTVNLSLALETASPRLQKIVGKNMNLTKLKENIKYILDKYPHVIVELESMHGFPTESEEEALMTLAFIKELKWLHFPYVHMLKIYPNTDMAKLAEKNGISKELIEKSSTLSYHEIPDTLPFSKGFTTKYQADFFNNYFMLKERLLYVLPLQMGVMTESELVAKYDSYLPISISNFDELLEFLNLTREDLAEAKFVEEAYGAVTNFNEMIKCYFPKKKSDEDAIKILFLDLSQLFSEDRGMIYDVVEAPLGHMYLLTYINKIFDKKVNGRIAKSRIDFDNYEELKKLIKEFNPDVIAIRTLTIYKDFFHKTVSIIRQWGIKTPIIAGGPYATSNSSDILKDSNIDLVAIGEGELTLRELIQKMIDNEKKLPQKEVLRNIPGIAFGENKQMSQDREIIFLDEIKEELNEKHQTNLPNITTQESLVYVIYTSGSTGKPKGVMLEHKNIINLIFHQFNRTDINFDEKILQFANMCFDAYFQEIFSALLRGGELNIINEKDKLNVEKLVDLIKEKEIKTVIFPTAYLKFLSADKDFNRTFPKTIQHIITAGEQLIINNSLKNYLLSTSIKLHNHYGPSETHVVTMMTLGKDSEIPSVPSIGKPISNTKIYILNERMNIQPVGIKGEIYIGGESVGRGYINNPELTAERFMESLFVSGERMYRTGDLGRWLPDGSIEFLGRIDHQVKIRGFRIELGEIESNILAFSAIKEAAVIDREETNGNKYLCAYIVCEEDINIAEIREELSKKMPDYMIPAYFLKIDKMPLTSTGKLNRKLLPKPEGRVGTASEFEAPRDEIEEKLSVIWRDILGIDKIGINDNFFELGGHSLKAISLASKISDAFNLIISISEIINRQSISNIAGYIRENINSEKTIKKNNSVLLKKGKNKKNNLFLIHEVSGGVEGYIDFARNIIDDFNCWGIIANDQGKIAPEYLNLEDVARSYLYKIKEIQKEGPYYIAGWSCGGTIAFEIVRQIEILNETVEFLGIIDSFPPEMKNKEEVEEFTIEAERLFINQIIREDNIHNIISRSQSLEEMYQSIVEYTDLNNMIKVYPNNEYKYFLEKIFLNYNKMNYKEQLRCLNTLRKYYRVCIDYIPSNKSDSPIYYFKANESLEVDENIWNNYCSKPIKTFIVKGDHFTILKNPNVREINDQFNSIIRSLIKKK